MSDVEKLREKLVEKAAEFVENNFMNSTPTDHIIIANAMLQGACVVLDFHNESLKS